MTILTRVGARLGILRVPRVGDRLWWAPKQLGCLVTAVSKDGVVTSQGGEIVQNSRGREVPRWTVMVRAEHARWDAATGLWVVGQGPEPKNVRGTVVTPDPVTVSGQARGSFARTGR